MYKSAKNATMYGGVATGATALALAGLAHEKGGVAGFIGMFFSFFVFITTLSCCIEACFHPLELWILIPILGLCLWYGYFFFRNLFHYIAVTYRGLVFVAKATWSGAKFTFNTLKMVFNSLRDYNGEKKKGLN